MASGEKIDVKFKVDPKQEVDKRQRGMFWGKETGIKEPKPIDISATFTIGSGRWDKKKLESGLRAMFREPLALFSTGMWENYAPIEKASNDRDKVKLIKVLEKKQAVMLKTLEKSLFDLVDDAIDDLEGGSGDDAKELKALVSKLDGDVIGSVGTEAVHCAETCETYVGYLVSYAARGDEKDDIEKLRSDYISNITDHLGTITKVGKKASDQLSAAVSQIEKSARKDLTDEAKKASETAKKVFKAASKTLAGELKGFEGAVKTVLKQMARDPVAKTAFQPAKVYATKLEKAAKQISKDMKTHENVLKKLQKAG